MKIIRTIENKHFHLCHTITYMVWLRYKKTTSENYIILPAITTISEVLLMMRGVVLHGRRFNSHSFFIQFTFHVTAHNIQQCNKLYIVIGIIICKVGMCTHKLINGKQISIWTSLNLAHGIHVTYL